MKLWQFILFLLIIANVSAQSIGVIPPERRLIVNTDEETITNIRLSHSADYVETVSIEPLDNYNWVKLKQKQIEMEPGKRYSVDMTIKTKNDGMYKAEFKICAKSKEGGTLSVVACNKHDLIVSSVPGKKNIVYQLLTGAVTALPGNKMILSSVLIVIAVVIGLFVYYTRKKY